MEKPSFGMPMGHSLSEFNGCMESVMEEPKNGSKMVYERFENNTPMAHCMACPHGGFVVAKKRNVLIGITDVEKAIHPGGLKMESYRRKPSTSMESVMGGEFVLMPKVESVKKDFFSMVKLGEIIFVGMPKVKK